MENFEMPKIKTKHVIVRFPTVFFSVVMIITLVVYFLVSVSFGSTLDVANFLILGTMELSTFYLYYPDGQLKGQESDRYKTNKKAYNDSANKVNKKRQNKNLQKYCIVDFHERIQEYIETEMGYCDLNYNDYVYLKKNVSQETLLNKKTKELEINGERVFLTKEMKKRLNKLLFKDLPIKANNSKTILSAVETSTTAEIKDKSKADKRFSQIRMIIKVVGIAWFSGYMLVQAKEGLDIETIAKLVIDLASIALVAVTSYLQGEKNQKVYKADFFIELALFLDNFFEWLLVEKKIDIDTFKPESLLEKDKVEEVKPILIEQKEKEPS